MDAVLYAHSDKQAKRIKKFIENPDSDAGIVTVPKVIGAGESVTVPAGRVAVLPNIQVDGTLNVEGEVFIPSGTTLSKVVELTGNQSIDGIKTFIKSPIVPTPTIGTQAVNKDYADLKVALTSFTGANQSIASNGYQKLPGGLIIQWGTVSLSTSVAKNWSSTTIVFPTAFSNHASNIWTSISVPVSNQLIITAGGSLATTSAVIYLNSESPISNQQINYIVVGK